jgi:hypothetical protein
LRVERGLETEKKKIDRAGALTLFWLDRIKLLKKDETTGPTLILDGVYLSLCIELAFNGTKELLVAVLGIAYVAGSLLVQTKKPH